MTSEKKQSNPASTGGAHFVDARRSRLGRRALMIAMGAAGAGVATSLVSDPEPASAAPTSTAFQYAPPASGMPDDAAMLNAWLAALPSACTVIFPSTIYRIRSATVVLPNGNRYYGAGSGQVAVEGEGKTHGQTVFQRQAGATLSAGNAIVSDAAFRQTSNNPQVGEPIHIEFLMIDGNVSADHATAGHGLAVCSERCALVRNTIEYTPQAGILLADKTGNGYNLSGGSMVECRVTGNTIISPHSYGIWIQDVTKQTITDGYMIDNIVKFPGDQAIRSERSAGWFYRGNHVYACSVDGFYFGNAHGTAVIDNECDQFGMAGAANTTYHGFNFDTILGQNVSENFDGHPVLCIGNKAWCDESLGKSTTSYNYYGFRMASPGLTAYVNFIGNGAHAMFGFVQPGSQAAVYAPSNSTMTVMDSGNLIDGPPQSRVVGPGTVWLGGGSTCFRQDPTVLPSATAGTFGTPIVFAPPGVPLKLINFAVVAGGTFRGETLTVKVETTFHNGSTGTFMHGFGSAGTYNPTPSDIESFFSNGLKVVSVAVSAMSTIGSSKANAVVHLFGWYGG